RGQRVLDKSVVKSAVVGQVNLQEVRFILRIHGIVERYGHSMSALHILLGDRKFIAIVLKNLAPFEPQLCFARLVCSAVISKSNNDRTRWKSHSGNADTKIAVPDHGITRPLNQIAAESILIGMEIGTGKRLIIRSKHWLIWRIRPALRALRQHWLRPCDEA